jgi:hypothetical protein
MPAARLHAQVLAMTQKFGIGAQFGGKCFCHDVRVVRLPRHAVSCPVAISVSCSADRQAKSSVNWPGSGCPLIRSWEAMSPAGCYSSGMGLDFLAAEQIMKVAKAGGTAANYFYDFDLWSFDIADDKLFVSEFNRIVTTPLSDPTSKLTIAQIGATSKLFIDSMTLTGSKVYIIDWNDGLSWTNLAGTQCEGLFAQGLFFGKVMLYDGYAYIQQDGGG